MFRPLWIVHPKFHLHHWQSGKEAQAKGQPQGKRGWKMGIQAKGAADWSTALRADLIDAWQKHPAIARFQLDAERELLCCADGMEKLEPHSGITLDQANSQRSTPIPARILRPSGLNRVFDSWL
jgi:hypothetical protein